jgi:choline dehydrogenase-like flavoprotein
VPVHPLCHTNDGRHAQNLVTVAAGAYREETSPAFEKRRFPPESAAAADFSLFPVGNSDKTGRDGRRRRKPQRVKRQRVNGFIDARTVPSGQVVETDLAIVGGGPAGISLALLLADSPIRMVLLESGGMEFDEKVQALYRGKIENDPYLPLDAVRLRYLGGASNHWGGWSRPLDEADFEKRDWLPYSGWPFSRKELMPYFSRAQSLIEAGPYLYDGVKDHLPKPEAELGTGGLDTRWFQFSKMKGDVLPTHFGERYANDLKRIGRLKVFLNANVVNLSLARDGGKLERLSVATLNGKRFTVKPKMVVLATGGIEVPRLMLASNDVRSAGVGNENDLVGRFFADHPCPRDVGKLVIFAGKLPGYYLGTQPIRKIVMRASFTPREDYRKNHPVMGSQTTVEYPDDLDEFGKAAVAATADALGVDASRAAVYSLGCGLEPAPDPDRRLTLDRPRDALGMPRLKLHMNISEADFDHYRTTLAELGRQLLASRTGMLRLNHKERGQWLDGIDWGNHHMGSTRMHPDPKQGVVDADGKVHSVANLFIAGSSVFPTYGASNPTINLIALTVRLSDHLRRVFK